MEGQDGLESGLDCGRIGFVGNILMSMGEDTGMDYLKTLAAQRVVNIEASSRAMLDQVIAGEYPMGLMMFNHHTVISAQKGAPSDWSKWSRCRSLSTPSAFSRTRRIPTPPACWSIF